MEILGLWGGIALSRLVWAIMWIRISFFSTITMKKSYIQGRPLVVSIQETTDLITLTWLCVLPLYRARLSGFFVAPETNNYTFWIQADSQASLHFSWSEDPTTKVFIFSFSFLLSPGLYARERNQLKCSCSIGGCNRPLQGLWSFKNNLAEM